MSVKCSHECLLRKRRTNVGDVYSACLMGTWRLLWCFWTVTTRGRMTTQLHWSTLKKIYILTLTFITSFKLLFGSIDALNVICFICLIFCMCETVYFCYHYYSYLGKGSCMYEWQSTTTAVWSQLYQQPIFLSQINTKILKCTRCAQCCENICLCESEMVLIITFKVGIEYICIFKSLTKWQQWIIYVVDRKHK